MTKIEICYWRRLSSWYTLDYVPGCNSERLVHFDDTHTLDDWQYCPFCGRPLSTATEGDDDDNAR